MKYKHEIHVLLKKCLIKKMQNVNSHSYWDVFDIVNWYFVLNKTNMYKQPTGQTSI